MSTHWASLSRSEVRDVGVERVQRELKRLDWSVRRSEDARSNLLVARRGAREIEVHVRVVCGLNYTFVPKRSFAPAPDRYVAYVRLLDGSPLELYLIPSRAWETPDELLPSRDFGAGMSSEPEYGIQVSQGCLEELEQRARGPRARPAPGLTAGK
jgi:hypothetical protein